MPDQPRIGDAVRFMSGQTMGRVDAVDGDRFRVAAEDVGVWLSTDAVFTRTIGRVTLVCESAGLGTYSPGNRRGGAGSGRSGERGVFIRRARP